MHLGNKGHTKLKAAVVSVALGIASLIGMTHSSVVAHASYCSIPIVSSPVTISVGVTTSSPQEVSVCFDSGPALPGGVNQAFQVDAEASPGLTGEAVRCTTTGAVGTTCFAGYNVAPTYTIGGSGVTVSIPFVVCVGLNCTTTGLQPTGLLVGTLVPCSSGGAYGACYQLSSLEVLVNGRPVVNLVGPFAGVGVNPFGQLGESLYGSSSGPCVAGECAPVSGYIETTGVPLLVVTLPSGGQVNVGAPRECLYNNNASCP